jgi:hypothetical protein
MGPGLTAERYRLSTHRSGQDTSGVVGRLPSTGGNLARSRRRHIPADLSVWHNAPGSRLDPGRNHLGRESCDPARSPGSTTRSETGSSGCPLRATVVVVLCALSTARRRRCAVEAGRTRPAARGAVAGAAGGRRRRWSSIRGVAGAGAGRRCGDDGPSRGYGSAWTAGGAEDEGDRADVLPPGAGSRGAARSVTSASTTVSALAAASVRPMTSTAPGTVCCGSTAPRRSRTPGWTSCRRRVPSRVPLPPPRGRRRRTSPGVRRPRTRPSRVRKVAPICS